MDHLGTPNSSIKISELLGQKVIGQPTAINGIVSAIKMYQAGLAPAGRPAGAFLLLGPTGTGKTRTVEALAEILHNDAQRVVKIDCGEYQSDHEVAKLLGAPPGYLGHRETKPALTQERLDEAMTPGCKLSLVLFDEIEKAAPAVSKLLLGVLDKAKLRLGDNSEVNFDQSIIFLTSNLGAREMMRELQPTLGFRPSNAAPSAVIQKLEAIAMNAVRRMYSPEFINRIDAVITYQPLGSEALALILDQQITDLQEHVNNRLGAKCFHIEVPQDARAFLLEKGTSPEYGARELKRAIHKHLTQPLATLVIESKVPPKSTVRMAVSDDKERLTFVTEGAPEKWAPVHAPTVLIVDDNRDFLRLLSLELAELTDWRVRTAQSVAGGKEICKEQMIDFALLDLILPDGNGIDLGIELRGIESGVHVAIMTGGELGTAEESESRKQGFDIVNKPFLPQTVISLVNERLARLTRATA